MRRVQDAARRGNFSVYVFRTTDARRPAGLLAHAVPSNLYQRIEERRTDGSLFVRVWKF